MGHKIEANTFYKCLIFPSKKINGKKINFEEFKEKCKNGIVFGEVKINPNDELTNNLGRMAFIVDDLEINDDGIYGFVKILNTPRGNFMKESTYHKYVIRPKYSIKNNKIKIHKVYAIPSEYDPFNVNTRIKL